MLVKELLNNLSEGALSNLALAEDEDNNGIGIRSDKLGQVIRAANEGLTKIYTRFLLREQELLICTIPGIMVYPLRKQFSRLAGRHNECFILDSIQKPFLGGVAKIRSVTAPNGRELRINAQDDPWAVFTPNPDTIQIPFVERLPGVYSIMYQALHPKIPLEGPERFEFEISIPEYLEGALESYIAYKVFSSMTGKEYIEKSQEQLAEYTAGCAEVMDQDLVTNTITTTHSKLEERGFI